MKTLSIKEKKDKFRSWFSEETRTNNDRLFRNCSDILMFWVEEAYREEKLHVILNPTREMLEGENDGDLESVPEKDELFDEAVDIVRAEGRASTSLLQRKLTIGYVKSTILMDQLEAHGIIGPKEGAKPRKVL